MSSRTLTLDDKLYEYLLRHGVREPKWGRELRDRTSRLPMAMMQISPEQGALMSMLVKLIGARRAIEVGTFTGYSALCVASALPADGKLIACDVSTEWTSIGREYWAKAGVEQKIDLRIGPAVQTLDALLSAGEAGRFDFGFIDADKANYDAYYERILRLLRPGGLVGIDNVLWSGRVVDRAANDADTVAIRALNDKLVADERIDLALLPIGDGLTLARKLGS
jgi:predicted O-methyltransferase YrrM